MNETPPAANHASRLPVLIGFLIVLGAVGAIFFFRADLQSVDRRRLDEARARWTEHGPKSYDLEVVVKGLQDAIYEVRVRDGVVAEAFRNQVPLKQERTFETWSVPGMFGTMESDVETLEFALANPTNPKRIMLTLKAKFDEKTGLPLEYLRSEWQSKIEVSWKVSRFEIK